jgi:hypothetical protein
MKVESGLGQRWYWTSEALEGNWQFREWKNETPYVRAKNKYLKDNVERYKTGKNVLGKQATNVPNDPA